MANQKLTTKEVRRNNRNRIFRYICEHDTVSNPDITADLHLSLPTVTNMTRELMESGLVLELGEMESTGGRRAKALSAASNIHFSIGLDLTKNHITILLVNLIGETIKQERIQQAFQPTDTYFSTVRQWIDAFIHNTPADSSSILGIGISLPGIVDLKQRTITHSHALALRSLPFSAIEKHFPWPCHFLNDANAGAYAEGIGNRQESSFFYLSLSNTVGGALFHQGHLLPGNSFRCGEVGHMTLLPDGAPCYCGKKGCVDAYCSASILSAPYNGKLEDFFHQLELQDPVCTQIWDTYLQHLAITVNNLHMILDYDIVLGGYVGSFLKNRLPEIRQQVAQRNTFDETGDFVKSCTYTIEAAAYGAAMDVMENFLCEV